MPKLIPSIAILSLLLLVGCSTGEKKEGETAAAEGDMMDSSLESAEASNEAPAEDLFAETNNNEEEKQADVPEISVSTSGETTEYTVEKGDTLLLIAFKVYGDYSKWKLIRDANKGVKSNNLVAGSTLKYPAPSEKFTWAPKGDAHLIKTGETLGSISNEKYGAVKRWREIYNNNKPMIKNPNLIFAGFTLYYIPDNREVASF
jgi:nucleoid-associated protein YgaU